MVIHSAFEILFFLFLVVGEAAGTAMGLVMAASLDNTAFREMVQYISDTAHDKIQRGLRTGLSLLAYGRMEEVEPWVNELLEAKSNAVLRQTAVCMLAMAYAGSGKADVVRRLLVRFYLFLKQKFTYFFIMFRLKLLLILIKMLNVLLLLQSVLFLASRFLLFYIKILKLYTYCMRIIWEK